MSSNPNGQPSPAARGGTSRPRDTFLHVTAALRLATYEDLLALDADVRAEIVRGALVVAPAPLPRHSKALVREGERWVEAGRFSDGDVVRIPPFEAIEPPAPPSEPTP